MSDRIATTSEIIQHAAHDRADTRLSTAGGTLRTHTPRKRWEPTGRHAPIRRHCRACGALYRATDPPGCCVSCGEVDA